LCRTQIRPFPFADGFAFFLKTFVHHKINRFFFGHSRRVNFLEEGEAVGKWKRANLSSTQLSTYYVGSIEVNDIRKAYEAKNKGKVDLLKMHDAMLSYGSPAPKYVKEMLDLK
jgi:hypothetical protein